MRVSVIIPAYNEELLIRRTLNSLQRQDYRDELEIIVVDNNSTDGTARVAAQCGAHVIREEQQGYVYAMIRGFRHASGDILLTTDADTILPQNWISTLARIFAEDHEAVAVGGMVDFYDANWKGRIFADIILPLALAYERFCYSYPHLWGANMAVRREAFLKAGGWTTKYNLQAETELCQRLARVGKVRMLRRLKVETSARRFNYALLTNLFIYGINFLGMQFLRRPIFFNFTAVRPASYNGHGNMLHKRRKWPLIYILAAAMALSCSSAASMVWGANKSSGKYVKHVATQEKLIALTFDDGPNEPYTSQVLEILREDGIHATFFLIGKNVQVSPETAKKIAEDGHVIGNHSYSHSLFLAAEPSNYQKRQIDQDERIIEQATGSHCTLFRPPRGIHSPWLLGAAAKRGLVSVGWSEDAKDWTNVSSAKIAAEIIRKARPGNIILLHDGLNLKHGVDRSKIVDALPNIIASLKARGYRFVTVPELLAASTSQPAHKAS